MIRGVYSLASAMDTAAINHEVVANNLAHVNTPGYRRQGLQVESFNPRQLTPSADAQPTSRVAAVRPGGAFTTFDSGPVQQTGNPFDLALNGDGFFVLDGPSGPLYSRNGTFTLGSDGQLQTQSGLRVRGNGGPIAIPPGASSVQIGQDGTISADGLEVGKLDIASFDRPELLRRAGDTTFEGPAPQTPPPGAVRVEQGYREGSNVNPVHEMVSMMLGYRHYEAAEKTLRAISDALGQQTRVQ